MASRKSAPPFRLIWILFGLLGAISLAFVGTGTAAWGSAIQTWARSDYLFSGWGMLDWIIGLLGAGLAGMGLLIAGVILRLLRRRSAPLASLFLSILSLTFILVTYGIYVQIKGGGSRADVLTLHLGCVIGLLLVALPPFLHWLLARPARQATTTPASGASEISEAS